MVRFHRRSVGRIVALSGALVRSLSPWLLCSICRSRPLWTACVAREPSRNYRAAVVPGARGPVGWAQPEHRRFGAAHPNLSPPFRTAFACYSARASETKLSTAPSDHSLRARGPRRPRSLRSLSALQQAPGPICKGLWRPSTDSLSISRPEGLQASRTFAQLLPAAGWSPPGAPLLS